MNVDIELYRVFCVVAECGSFSKAAEKLFVSQPAVTQSIKKLENQLNGALFYRIPKGIVLTEEGKKFYEYIKPNIEAINNAENKFSQYINLEEGRIRIKTGNDLGSILIYDAVNKFLQLYPKIKIDILSGLTRESIEELSKGEIDLVALNLPYETQYSNIDIIEIKEIEECFYVSKEYYEKNKNKSIIKLIETEMIIPNEVSHTGKRFISFCEKNNLHIKPKMMIASASVRNRFIEQGVGIGFGIKERIKEKLDNGTFVELKIGEEISKRKIGVAILNKEIASNAVLKFLEMIKKAQTN